MLKYPPARKIEEHPETFEKIEMSEQSYTPVIQPLGKLSARREHTHPVQLDRNISVVSRLVRSANSA